MTDTGWTDGGTFANVDRDSKDPWSNPSNAQSSDDNDASCDIPKEDYNDWLRVTNFGFSIPSGATINGIEVRIERAGESSNISDSSLRLVLSGTPTGDDKASATAWPGSDAYASYGGASDTWSSGFDRDDINDSTFGVQLSAYNDNQYVARMAWVDHIQIKIYYTEGGLEGYFSRKVTRIVQAESQFSRKVTRIVQAENRFSRSLVRIVQGENRFSRSLVRIVQAENRFSRVLTRIVQAEGYFSRSLTRIIQAEGRFSRSLTRTVAGLVLVGDAFVEVAKVIDYMTDVDKKIDYYAEVAKATDYKVEVDKKTEYYVEVGKKIDYKVEVDKK